ncbi:unnamed protein product [Prorocentrum cordatum]|uniref:Uncharacterized protein n=1 Tax=Prorocentrum cordatum TaxID=2364126 RepID=A0ABN9W6H3_9DINO|nr:unnamed protein product [Polarella glacialis]
MIIKRLSSGAAPAPIQGIRASPPKKTPTAPRAERTPGLLPDRQRSLPNYESVCGTSSLFWGSWMRATSPPAPLLLRRALLRLGAGGARLAPPPAARCRARAAASAGRVLVLALLLPSSRRGTAAVKQWRSVPARK